MKSSSIHSADSLQPSRFIFGKWKGKILHKLRCFPFFFCSYGHVFFMYGNFFFFNVFLMPLCFLFVFFVKGHIRVFQNEKAVNGLVVHVINTLVLLNRLCKEKLVMIHYGKQSEMLCFKGGNSPFFFFSNQNLVFQKNMQSCNQWLFFSVVLKWNSHDLLQQTL